jgi:hypothetical protein
VGENICRIRTDCYHPITGAVGLREDVLISDYRVWTETAKDDVWICKEKSVTEMSV